MDALTTAENNLVREILEAVCQRGGISLLNADGGPARNYELMLRLGIGHVLGLEPDQEARAVLTEAVRKYHQPRRGDDVEAWLEHWLEGLPARTSAEREAYATVSELLADYRLYADTGTPLDLVIRDEERG